MVGTGIICLFMATFMSHTATASLLIPIIAVVGVNMGDNLAPMGGRYRPAGIRGFRLLSGHEPSHQHPP